MQPMKRRDFLGGLGLAITGTAHAQEAAEAAKNTTQRGGMRRADSGFPGGLQPLDGGKVGNSGPMKISAIKTFLVGADGKIQDSVLADLRIGAHEEFVQTALAAGAI